MYSTVQHTETKKIKHPGNITNNPTHNNSHNTHAKKLSSMNIQQKATEDGWSILLFYEKQKQKQKQKKISRLEQS